MKRVNTTDKPKIEKRKENATCKKPAWAAHTRWAGGGARGGRGLLFGAGGFSVCGNAPAGFGDASTAGFGTAGFGAAGTAGFGGVITMTMRSRTT